MKQKTIKFYEKGIYKEKTGHLRYSSPVELRGKYVHRVVVDKLIAETPYSVVLMLPWPYEVHHMDYNKEHNCPYNFLILDVVFHSHLTAHRERGPGGEWGSKFHPKWKLPESQPLLDKINDNVVPF